MQAFGVTCQFEDPTDTYHPHDTENTDAPRRFLGHAECDVKRENWKKVQDV